MKLHDFINLSPEHTISFEDGEELQEDIAINGSAGLTKDQSHQLLEYLDICLLYETVDLSLRANLEEICEYVRNSDGN